METVVLLILWGISIPLCVRFAKEIGSSQVIAGLAGLAAPILAPIGYWYIASNKKVGKLNKDEILRQIGVVVVVLLALYFIAQIFSR